MTVYQALKKIDDPKVREVLEKYVIINEIERLLFRNFSWIRELI